MLQPFTRALLEWYDPKRRVLPWKNTRDPYRIWLSEIMLQQTRVEQGIPYYHRFIEAFPTVSDLALAPSARVMKLWEGLGYYSRARNLHSAAQQVVHEFGGKFPESYDDIRSLKGVGDYTAAAIASFAFDQPYAVLDGNVFRVLSRYFGESVPVDTSAGKKYYSRLARSLLPEDDAARYNQAIMDFGALVCTPRQPKCNHCPLSATCKALIAGNPLDYPVKTKAASRTERYFNYIIKKLPAASTEIRLRGKGDVWAGLYEFPMIESGEPVSKKMLLTLLREKENIHNVSVRKICTLRQDLTHRRIWATFWTVNVGNDGITGISVPLTALDNYAFPRVIRTFLGDFDILSI